MNGVNVEFLLSFICDQANLCAAKAFSLSANSDLNFSSIDGILVWVKARGIEMGEYPIVCLNGVWVRLMCLRLLCVNLRVVRDFSHSSGCEEQYIERYASISSFTCLVALSECGWYAVVRAEVMLSNFIISWKAHAANWGPRSDMILSGSPYRLYKLLSKS